MFITVYELKKIEFNYYKKCVYNYKKRTNPKKEVKISQNNNTDFKSLLISISITVWFCDR